jgi:hypothetical protein
MMTDLTKTISMANKFFLLKTIFLLFIFVALLIGCSKTTTPVAGNPHNPTMLIINASPNSTPLGLYVNSGTIFDSLYYTKAFGYFQLGTGYFAMQFFRTDTAKTFLQDTIIDANNDTTYKNTDSLLYQINNIVTLDTAKITVQSDSAYSLFLVDSASKIKHVFVTDALADSGSGTPKLRFFNFSPNGPALDLAVSGGQVLFSSRSFNDVSTNQLLSKFSASAAGTYNFEIRLAGTTTAIATITGVVFKAGKHYTLYAKGFYGGTGNQALGIGYIANN